MYPKFCRRSYLPKNKIYKFYDYTNQTHKNKNKISNKFAKQWKKQGKGQEEMACKKKRKVKRKEEPIVRLELSESSMAVAEAVVELAEALLATPL